MSGGLKHNREACKTGLLSVLGSYIILWNRKIKKDLKQNAGISELLVVFQSTDTDWFTVGSIYTKVTRNQYRKPVEIYMKTNLVIGSAQWLSLNCNY